ncbi:phage tail sheath subtilisin-like domain-containing protein [Paraburkholderia sp. D15]|uniref:phage tail sheath family protein n=1 Tax=Paraburkholderia sp. D15 TaxID=2880218 RepID=UPI002478C645|nr:phage tail sheath C-terminal domain-containing protein [Paraburkholderia sp. D15]WGS53960.1 phage tail sheath subtilisin-like domain-containing protein [Paraburkholderia sp. D15]
MQPGQPDVTYTEGAVANRFSPVASAVPVFIGYVESGDAYALYPVGSMAEYEQKLGGAPASKGLLYYALQHHFDNGGKGGWVIPVGSYADLANASGAQMAAAFGDPRIGQLIAAELSITLAAIPDMGLLDDKDTANWPKSWLALLSLCGVRTGVFGVLDAPDDVNYASACATSFLQNDPANPEWSAAYWPRLVTDYNWPDDSAVVLPASGAVIAAMQLTDEEQGTWTAPANIALARVVKPTQSWIQSEPLFDANGVSINLIRSFAGRGTRIWGCRTLTPDAESPWRYVQVRRFVAYVEAQLSQLGRRYVFEQNNALTWARLKGQSYAWLRQLWMSGSLAGETEEDAFQVEIGVGETMTDDDVQAGKMIMNVGLAVLYPAEFIDISVQFDTSMKSSGQSIPE